MKIEITLDDKILGDGKRISLLIQDLIEEEIKLIARKVVAKEVRKQREVLNDAIRTAVEKRLPMPSLADVFQSQPIDNVAVLKKPSA